MANYSTQLIEAIPQVKKNMKTIHKLEKPMEQPLSDMPQDGSLSFSFFYQQRTTLGQSYGVPIMLPPFSTSLPLPTLSVYVTIYMLLVQPPSHLFFGLDFIFKSLKQVCLYSNQLLVDLSEDILFYQNLNIFNVDLKLFIQRWEIQST